jgi:hypothetical protein
MDKPSKFALTHYIDYEIGRFPLLWRGVRFACRTGKGEVISGPSAEERGDSRSKLFDLKSNKHELYHQLSSTHYNLVGIKP